VELNGLPASGTWTINPGAISNSGVSTTISGLSPGTYNFTVTNTAACVSPASVTIELTNPQQLTFTLETSVSPDGNYSIDCAGAESGYITVQALNATGAVDYLWSDGETGNSRTNLSAGTYRIIMTDANNCQADSSIILAEPDIIKAVFEVNKASCPDQPDGEIILTATGGVPGTDYIYLWSDDDNSTGRNISNIPAGLYNVTITDANNCSVTESVTLHSENEICLIMSDAFSPNGDLFNDVWNIGNTGLYPSMEITILNRWGQSVWKSGRGYPVPWDGKSNGVDIPVDSYHYIIDLHNGSKPIVGDVTIVR
jgi:gliding motility-associated-like protein